MTGHAVVPLIECGTDGAYRANPETLAWIAAHKKPFGVIVAAGKYRTGKSFMLNQLTHSAPGFGVGETVQACTKGLWVCKHFFPVSDEMDALFVDTEGIDALDASDDTDVRIFTLALLLSSSFLYNSVGHIDEAALSTLGLMARVTDSIRQASEGVEDVPMPNFAWVLRDFSLRLEDKQGRALAPDEYLEHALEPSTAPAAGDARDATRASIRSFFASRHLFTLPRPSKEENAQGMNAKPWLISAKFHEGIDALRTKLFATLRPMRTRGDKPLTGAMYARLCEHMAEHGKSQVPVMRDTWALMAAVQARELKDELLHRFSTELDEWGADDIDVLRARADAQRAQLMQEFRATCMPPVDAEVVASLDAALERAATARVQAIGLDHHQLVRASLDNLDVVVRTTPQTCGELLTATRQAFCAEHGERAATAWRAEAGDRAITSWVPLLTRGWTRAVDEARDAAGTALEEVRAELAEARTAHQDYVRDHGLALQESEAMRAAAEAQRDDERAAAEAARAEAAEAHTRLADAQSTLEALRAAVAEGGEHGDGDREGAAAAVDGDLEQRLTQAIHECATAQARADEMVARVDIVEENLARAQAQVEQARTREAQLTASWEQGLASVREEAQRALERERAAVRDAEGKLGQATADLDAARDRIERHEKTIETQKASWERETRQLNELSERHRDMCEKAQQRVVEMHRSMLDDLRVRDEKVRQMQAEFTTERHQLQATLAQTTRELETRGVELSANKRRLVDLEQADADNKRLRVEIQSHSAQKIRDDAEREHLAQQLSKMTRERDDLRDTNVGLDNELAMLRAEKKLHETRQGFSQ